MKQVSGNHGGCCNDCAPDRLQQCAKGYVPEGYVPEGYLDGWIQSADNSGSTTWQKEPTHAR